MRNLVSFIVPVYNGGAWIDRCLSSIQAQTYLDLEVLIVDDGSKDDSLAQCTAFAETDRRFRVYSIEHCGLSCARNYALSQANGDYIGFVDIDDWLENCFTEVLLDILMSQDAEVASCSCAPTSGSGEPVAGKPWPGLAKRFHAEDYLRLVYRDPTVNVCMGNKLYAQRLFKGVRFPESRLYEDVTTNYLLCRGCRGAAHLPIPLYHYFTANESITRSSLREQDLDLTFQWAQVYELAKNDFPGLASLVQDMQVMALRSLADKYLHHGGDAAVAKMLVHSFRASLPHIVSSREIPFGKKLRSLAGAVNLSLYQAVTDLIRRDS